MKKGRVLMIMVFIMIETICFADDYTYLIIKQSDATESSVALSSLKKIVFSNGTMIMTNTDGTSSDYSLSDLSMMYFSTATAGINSAVNSKLAYISDGILKINTAGGAKVDLYATTGAHISTLKTSADEAEINMGSLPKGLYLLKVNDKIQKILNK